MKICVLTQQIGHRWSGLGTYATNLVEGLVARGCSPTVVCPEGMGEGLGVPIITVKTAGWQKAINYWLPLAWEFRKAVGRIQSENPHDIVHFTDAREALFAPSGKHATTGTMNDYYAASSPANPLYFMRHYSDWPLRYPYYRVTRRIEPFALRRLDTAIANSEYVKDVLVRNYGLDPDRVVVVNYGIAHPDLGGEEEPLEGEPSILFVGANFQRKGLPDLLRAVALARGSLKDPVVHVAGEDSKEKVIRDLAHELGIERSVKFHGLVPNDRVRRMKADMFVMPSLIEGFGIVFLEAMHSGIPVIGGRVGGTAELIRDGENGFSVRPGDVEDLSRKIIQLATDKNLRKKFIDAGVKTTREYSIPKMVDKTLELYKKLLGAGSEK